MIVIEVTNLGSEEKPSLSALVEIGRAGANTSYRRRVVHHHDGKKLLEGLAEIDDTNSCLHDLAQAAFLLGMTYERVNPHYYTIPGAPNKA
jgi:hypothetical protein